MTYESDPTRGTQIVLPGPNAEIRSWFPSLQAVASEIRVRTSIDPISMAYVALTRAKTAVHLVAQPYVQKTDGKKNVSIQRSLLGCLPSRTWISPALGSPQVRTPQGCCGPWKIREKLNAMSLKSTPRIPRAVHGV